MILSKKFWSNYFKVYDYLNLLIPYKQLIEYFIDYLNIRSGDIVLDLGSGTGNFSIELRKIGAVVYSIDSSEEGNQLHLKKDPTAIIVTSDITNRLPFEDNYFDKIFSNNTLYTIDPAKRLDVFNEINRIIKPGGVFVVSNLRQHFSPFSIYIDHLKLSIKEKGLFFTIIDMLKLCIPTIKIFYYNIVIKYSNKDRSYTFFTDDEQRNLLINSGFVDVTDNIYVYANQAILNMAKKNDK
jgi:ubiquinone/menaquinone biosynthesis C-methylase UbiE